MTIIPCEKVLPNPDQPRTLFDKEELDGLAQSLKETGLVQPIVVEQSMDEYILIDGERRLRAAKMLGWKEIEAHVRSNGKVNGNRLTQALVANVQRSDIGYIDEAKAYQALVHELGSIKAVAEKVGVTIATIGTRLALLELDETVQGFYNKKLLPVSTSVLADLKDLDKEQQRKIATTAVTRQWNTKTFQLMLRKVDSPRQIGVDRGRKARIEFAAGDGKGALGVAGMSLSEEITRAATETCQECPLYADADMNICKECPLPAFLRRIGSTDEKDGRGCRS